MTPGAAPAKRGVLFWVLVAGGSAFGCCVLSIGIAAVVGATSDDAPSGGGSAPAAAAAASGEEDDFIYHSPNNGMNWVAESSVAAEGVAVTLAGEWREDHRNIVFRVRDDGTYELSESGGVLVGEKISNATAIGSRTSERGRWSIEGSVLTLTPEGREGSGSVGLHRTETEEQAPDSARAWNITGLTIRYTPHGSNTQRERPAIRVQGEAPPWYYPSGSMNWTLRSAPWSGD